MLAAPLGIVLGYTLTYHMNQYHSWEWSFCIQAIALVPCIICMAFIPSKYYNVEETIEFKNRSKGSDDDDESVTNDSDLDVSRSMSIGFAQDDQSLAQKLRALKGNTVFIKLCASLTFLYYVVTGI